MRSRARYATTVVGVIALWAINCGPASAAESADGTASLVTDLAPGSHRVIAGHPQGSGVRTVTGDIALEAPSDPADPVVIRNASDATEISIALPDEFDLGGARVASDGSIVYSSDIGSVAIQALDDGSTRIATISQREDQASFTYSFGGEVTPVVQADGSVLLTMSSGGRAVPIGSVAAPWASDAVGAPVPTHYVVDGSRLVQVLEFTRATQFPVVADPTISFGWFVYVKYWRNEVHAIATSPLSDKAKYSSLICAVIPNPVYAAGCGLAAYDIQTSIVSTFKSADKVKKCVQIGYIPVITPPAIAGVPVSWHVVTC